MDPRVIKSSNISPSNNALKSNVQNSKAYVMANYGDPGIENDNFCDIRSRFIIAIKDPLKRPLIPKNSDGSSIFLQDNIILVQRPYNLWIDCPLTSQPAGFNPANPDFTNFKRYDSLKNYNIGSKDSYSASNIVQINRPYKLAEQITIGKLNNYLTADDTFFQSVFSKTSNPYSDMLYNNTSMLGMALPRVLNSNGFLAAGGRDSSLFDPTKNYYLITFHQSYYEYFLQTYFSNNSWYYNSPSAYMPFNNEYVFQNRTYITFYCESYLDLNTDSKARESNASCLPTIVTPKDSFLTLKARTSATLIYQQI